MRLDETTPSNGRTKCSSAGKGCHYLGWELRNFRSKKAFCRAEQVEKMPNGKSSLDLCLRRDLWGAWRTDFNWQPGQEKEASCAMGSQGICLNWLKSLVAFLKITIWTHSSISPPCLCVSSFIQTGACGTAEVDGHTGASGISTSCSHTVHLHSGTAEGCWAWSRTMGIKSPSDSYKLCGLGQATSPSEKQFIHLQNDR